MSMKIVIASFEEDKNKKLLADYKLLSEEVIVTEFLDSFLESSDIGYFKVFEEDEEVLYKEIKSNSIKPMSIELDKRSKEIFHNIRETLGNKKREKLLDNLEDIFYLNILLKKFCQELLLNNKSKIKLIII